ncbi:hypothetical protein CcaverHIS002_0103240 [Cutaneotrichosporon cavernicola]|uniref:Uncharacterized protein n=1 Tax=Cutaneotrichosporon cavernicola TaxID=279322 RepID=A0AA48I5V0_9TREE|nr:uncharacterized protein CcaverHIS019_0103180 [Cutaneotrichosporon cavernicola]BEI79795.1 hypothetical protein CcaverHIS002_0103240 [Cutaneotrichosporon cavernicola]BEI87600.1 hypothetical protein CcaverHIS019_0103180 [Cutaneotrichosporon cavernicola]BEI95371.1 hypothetical protein CcaverHIS631_0103200 [Cutaneotrichosporon cavernicola]
MPPKRKPASPSPSSKKKRQAKKAKVEESDDDISDDSLSPSFENDDDEEADDGLRSETLREIARLEADARVKVEVMDAKSDAMDRINSKLDGMKGSQSTLQLRQMFETRVNLFEDLVQSVSAGNAATTRTALDGAFLSAKTYYGETRPQETGQAGEDARGMVCTAAGKANDGDAYRDAMDIIRSMRKQAQKAGWRWR